MLVLSLAYKFRSPDLGQCRHYRMVFIRVEDFGHEFYAITESDHVSLGIYTFVDFLNVDRRSAFRSSSFGRSGTQCVDVKSDSAFGQLVFFVDQEASAGVVVQFSVLKIDCQ